GKEREGEREREREKERERERERDREREIERERERERERGREGESKRSGEQPIMKLVFLRALYGQIKLSVPQSWMSGCTRSGYLFPCELGYHMIHRLTS